MPMSGSNSSSRQGLTLIAWALVKNSNTIIKSQNIASITKASAGQFTLTLQNAMPNTDAIVFGEFSSAYISSNPFAVTNIASTTTISVQTYFNGSGVFDVTQPCYITVWQ